MDPWRYIFLGVNLAAVLSISALGFLDVLENGLATIGVGVFFMGLGLLWALGEVLIFLKHRPNLEYVLGLIFTIMGTVAFLMTVLLTGVVLFRIFLEDPKVITVPLITGAIAAYLLMCGLKRIGHSRQYQPQGFPVLLAQPTSHQLREAKSTSVDPPGIHQSTDQP